MNNIKIYGFSGKIGVGKNYIAEQQFGKKLYNKGYIIHILAFADQTKYELGSRLNLSKDDFITEMDDTYNLLFINKDADTRKKLQIYGTEYCRNGGEISIKNKFTIYNQPNIWIRGLYLQIKNILLKSYEAEKNIFIITDVRFINEANFIKSLNGKNIRINSTTRNTTKILEEAHKNFSSKEDINNYVNQVKNHESETNLDDYIFDYVLNNEPNMNIDNYIDEIINNI